MILTLRKAWAASSMISEDSLDSAMFSLSCLMPLPPVLGVPFLSITLSHSFFASLPPFSFSSRARTTGNSPLKRGSFSGVHGVLVHLEQVQVHSWNSFDEALKGCVDLELLEEAGNHAASGGPGEADLVGHDDGGVDGGADQGVADDVGVGLQGRGRVAHRNTPMNQAGEIFLCLQHSFGEGCQLLDLDLLLFLADGDILQLAAVLLHAALNHLEELGLIGLDEVAGDSSKLGIFSNLVWRPRANWLAVDIDIGLLPQVQPDDWAVLGVDGAGHLLEDVLDAIKGGLAAGVDLVAWDPVEVGTTWEGVRQLLHLVELVGHGRGLPYFRVVRHPGE